MQPSDFVKQMMALWKKPNETANIQIAAEQYQESLKTFTPAQLDAGWIVLRDTHDRTAWPLISECRKAVLSAVASDRPRQWTGGKPDHTNFANSAMRSHMAISAKSEGWLLGLWDFCKVEGRLPHAHEVGRIKGSAREANHAAANLGDHPFSATLHRLWAAMRDREQRLARLVLDQAA